jgi:hypothetical protein
VLSAQNGYESAKFFFLLTFAAVIPPLSGGIAERARFNPQLAATLRWWGWLDPEAEFTGTDLSIHKVSATQERETNG